MSYRAGIGPGMRALGLTPREAHIVCDGCGATHTIYTKRGDVARWFMRRSHPPKWRHSTNRDGTYRQDLCPECLERMRSQEGGGDGVFDTSEAARQALC